MAKDPAFLFYPNDYIGGTMGMTFEEKGAYIELLMLQFNRGHMTKHMMAHTVGQLLDKLLDKFQIDENGLYYNVRLEEEQIKRKTFTASRKNNLKGTNQYTKKEQKNIGHMTSHMENVNIDTNNINKIKEEFKNSEILIENLAKRYNCTPDHIHLRMKHYWLEKSATFEPSVTLQEVRRHFGNWLKIDLTKNPIHRINQ
jgi:uncharacterized protein YdaU (DUF1376 family)